MIDDVMKLYSKETHNGIQFKAIKDCTNPEYCNGCKHFVNFEFELDEAFDVDDMDCWSYVAYLPDLNRELREETRLLAPYILEGSWLMKLIKRLTIGTDDGTTKTYQPLNLSPQCWDKSTVAHEIGHVSSPSSTRAYGAKQQIHYDAWRAGRDQMDRDPPP